ncbi:unnamed protein product [Psylliodes chrysocephalus]|uniref:Uncharacterized protein n=1 Tax=Psylliodes chrysocephalus TaxID=3402493 RepID=A0A9P0G944_9CUCU|nr:unnamed protein product [Psylliodes chrysocephala]
MWFVLHVFVVLVFIQTSCAVPPHHYPHPHHPIPHHPIPHQPELPQCNGIFPQYFSFGVSSGAYEHEGAWNVDGKGENIWDRWVHENPGVVIDGTNGDETADAYHHLDEDVEILNNLTVRHYSFTISWARLIPLGCGEVNKAAVRHYQRLLYLLKENRIEPIVNLYNGVLPQALEDQGGFLSDDFVSWYTEYAKIAFECFGSSVKYWVTFSDPTTQCHEGYGVGTFPPGISNNPGINEYICGHNTLKAHASVYHLYDDSYRQIQKGKISIKLLGRWNEPATDCQTDIEAAERRMQFEVGWFAHPIYIGDYPQVMIDRIGELSELQGLCESRLPVFTRKEIEWIKDTHDFFGLIYFSSFTLRAIEDDSCISPSYDSDSGSEIIGRVEGDDTYGIRKMIVWTKNQYHNPSIFLLGNGYVSGDRTLEDNDRIEYIKNILIHIRAAQTNDDARVYGYTYGNFIDGFIRTYGHTFKLGLYDVEFDCPTKPRTARKSVEYFQHVCKYGCIDNPCPPRHHHEYYGEHNIY